MRYTTIQGDTWDQIAFRSFGTEKYMVELIDANPDFASTVIFGAGVVLSVPTIAMVAQTNLPPWKRG